MWGLFVGLAIGALQVLALYKLGRMILGDKLAAKFIGALLLLVKIALIVLILVLVASVSLTHLIWTAVGMLAGVIATLAIMLVRSRRRTQNSTGSVADGKDDSDG
jgi:hypothetical protein